MDLKDKKIILGTITSSYGLRGYFKVLSFTEQPKQLINYSPLFISEEKIIKLKIKYVKKNILICSSSNINSKNDVDTILKENIYTYRSNFPKINEFYHVDLIGMKVKNFDKVIGKVVALYNFGAENYILTQNRHVTGRSTNIKTITYTLKRESYTPPMSIYQPLMCYHIVF